MIRLFHVAGAVVLLVLLGSCKGTGQPPGPYHEFTFTVDSTQLGEPLRFSGMELCLPRSSVEAPPESMNQIRAAAERDSGEFGLTPEYVYYDSLGSIQVFSHFRHYDEKVDDFVSFARGFTEKLRTAPDAELPSQEWLTLGGIQAVQFYTSDSVRVQFSYVLDADRPVHLAVSVPREIWTQEVRAIESMLGTLHKAK